VLHQHRSPARPSSNTGGSAQTALLKQLVIDLFSLQHSVMTWSNSPSLSSDSICVRSQIGGVATTHRTWAGRGTGESVGRLFFLLFFHSATHVLLSIQSLNQDLEKAVCGSRSRIPYACIQCAAGHAGRCHSCCVSLLCVCTRCTQQILLPCIALLAANWDVRPALAWKM